MVVIAGVMGIAITSLINNLGNPSGTVFWLCPHCLCVQTPCIQAQIAQRTRQSTEAVDISKALIPQHILTTTSHSHNTIDYLLCSDVDAMTKDGFPLVPQFSKDEVNFPTSPGSSIPNAKSDATIKHVNWYIIPGDLGFGASPTITADSCVWWFEKDYPYSTPYAKNPNITTPGANLDSTYKPQPQGGWLGPQQLALPIQLTTQQVYPWALIADTTGGRAGSRPQQPLVDAKATNLTGQSFGTGLLGAMDTYYYANVSTDPITAFPGLSGFQAVPYYQEASGSSSANDVDDALTNKIRTLVEGLSRVNKSALLAEKPTPQQRVEYFSQVGALVQNMPIGALIFSAIDSVAKRFDYTLQIGTDIRLLRASNYPSRGLRLMQQHTSLANAIRMYQSPISLIFFQTCFNECLRCLLTWMRMNTSENIVGRQCDKDHPRIPWHASIVHHKGRPPYCIVCWKNLVSVRSLVLAAYLRHYTC